MRASAPIPNLAVMIRKNENDMSTIAIRLFAAALLSSLIALSACAKMDAPVSESHAVTIMTFNVENLFDNDDDPGKDDRTFWAIED